MGFKDIIGKAKRRGREPLGAGYGVHGAGGITETGGKSYKAVAGPIIRKKKQEDFKAGITKIAKAGQKMGQRMAEAQGSQGQTGKMQAPGMQTGGMGLFGPPQTPGKPKAPTKPRAPTARGTKITLPSGEVITIAPARKKTPPKPKKPKPQPQQGFGIF